MHTATVYPTMQHSKFNTIKWKLFLINALDFAKVDQGEKGPFIPTTVKVLAVETAVCMQVTVGMT